MSKPSLITIDGPAAVGKSTLGRLLARKLGYRFIDTGSMYRSLTRLALERQIDLADEQALTDLARRTPVEALAIDNHGPGGAGVHGTAPSSNGLTDPSVEAAVPIVSRVPGLRLALVEKQRYLAQGGKVVMVGRDIGTIVLPQAEVKLFLMASVAERARRRHLEMTSKGGQVDYQKVLEDVQKRDKVDRERKDSPLTPAPGATIINTDKMAMEKVAERVLRLIGSC
ncbi:MAG: (d)CMP kinase [Dehalococcoidia bacterium]|nr:(d)CMP kinase [Dehalococcoidia bacterium]